MDDMGKDFAQSTNSVIMNTSLENMLNHAPNKDNVYYYNNAVLKQWQIFFVMLKLCVHVMQLLLFVQGADKCMICSKCKWYYITNEYSSCLNYFMLWIPPCLCKPKIPQMQWTSCIKSGSKPTYFGVSQIPYLYLLLPCSVKHTPNKGVINNHQTLVIRSAR